MKKWAGHKSFDVIKQQCKDAGIHFSDQSYRKGGDCVVVSTVKGDEKSGQVMYNTVNGVFFGVTPEGVEFDSNHATHDREEWFQKLLAFFYIEKA
jgi:hypothetical protein